MPEPYASMVYVAVYTGLRVSGLCALRWRNVHESSISIGADVKDARAQMRLSRASTSLDNYQQLVPESERRGAERLSMLSRLVP